MSVPTHAPTTAVAPSAVTSSPPTATSAPPGNEQHNLSTCNPMQQPQLAPSPPDQEALIAPAMHGTATTEPPAVQPVVAQNTSQQLDLLGELDGVGTPSFSAPQLVAPPVVAPAQVAGTCAMPQEASQVLPAVTVGESANDVHLTVSAQVAAQSSHHAASNHAPGRTLGSPKLTVACVDESATQEDLLPGFSSTVHPIQSSVPDEEIQAALDSIDQVVVTGVMMVIQQGNCKFNVAFDFNKAHDTGLGIAKELQDANIVPRNIAMEDLINDIEHAIIARCRALADRSTAAGATYSPERDNQERMSVSELMPDSTDATFRETLQPEGDGMVPESEFAPSKQVLEQQSMSSQLPFRDPSKVPLSASANSLADSAALGEDVQPCDQTSPRAHLDAEESALPAQCGGNVEGELSRPAAELADQQGTAEGGTVLGAEEMDSASPTAVQNTSAPEPASDTVEEERRWVALGWAKAESQPQALADALKKNLVSSDDPVQREQLILLQRSLAYLIPEVNVGDFKQMGIWCEATSKAVSSFQKYHSLSSETGITEEKFWEKVSDQVKRRDEKEGEKRAKREADRKRSQQVREQRKQEQDRESALQLEQMMNLCHTNLHPAPAKSTEEKGVASTAANAPAPVQQMVPQTSFS